MCGVWYTWIAACCLVEDLPLGHQGYLMVVVASDREAAMVGFGSMQLSELTQGETLDVLVVLPNAEKRLPSNLRPFYVRSSHNDAPQAPRLGGR